MWESIKADRADNLIEKFDRNGCITELLQYSNMRLVLELFGASTTCYIYILQSFSCASPHSTVLTYWDDGEYLYLKSYMKMLELGPDPYWPSPNPERFFEISILKFAGVIPIAWKILEWYTISSLGFPAWGCPPPVFTWKAAGVILIAWKATLVNNFEGSAPSDHSIRHWNFFRRVDVKLIRRNPRCWSILFRDKIFSLRPCVGVVASTVISAVSRVRTSFHTPVGLLKKR